MRFGCIILAILVLIASCSIEKRLYRDGFYVHRHSTETPNTLANGESRSNAVITESCITYDSLVEQCDNNVLSPDPSFHETVNHGISSADTSEPVVTFTTIPQHETKIRKDSSEIKRIDQWKYAGAAILSAALGIFLGPLILQFIPQPWFLFTLAGISVLAIGFFIFLSVRAHWIYKRADPKDGTQSPIVWLIRIALYALALIAAYLIVMISLLWGLW